MRTNTVSVPLEVIVKLLKNLNEEAKEKIFEEVFLETDTSPLTEEEKKLLETAEKELREGETIPWGYGK